MNDERRPRGGDRATKKKREVAVRLRVFTSDDIPRKIAWVHDPRVNRFLHHELPLTEEKVRAWLERMHDEDRHDLIIETLSGKPLGTIGLENFDRQHRRGEKYICIGETAYWGTTASVNAATLLYNYAFLQLGLNRVFSVTENMAAMVHNSKLGFQMEGILRHHYMRNEVPCNGIATSLVATEYLSRQDRLAEPDSVRPDALRLYEQVIRDFLHPGPGFAPAQGETGSPVGVDPFERFRDQPGLDRVLAMLDHAGRKRRGGRCGEVPIEPQANDAWLDLLHALVSLSRTQTEIDILRSAQDVSSAAETCHRLVPLTPALWQTVFTALRTSLMAPSHAPRHLRENDVQC